MADIDKDKPGDSDLLSNFPQNERDSRSAIETILGVDHEAGNDTADDGKHKVVQLLAQTTPTAAAGEGNFYTKDVGGGVIELFYQDAAGNEVQLTDSGAPYGFESGTKMIFFQASAPTGWTQDTAVNDRVLRVVDGAGGGTGGSWTISGLSVDGHTLTVSEIPSHNHGGSTGSAGSHTHNVKSADGSPIATRDTGLGTTADTISIASNDKDVDSTDLTSTSNPGNHSHSIPSEGGDGSHSHGLTADGTWRPSHIDVIAASKD